MCRASQTTMSNLTGGLRLQKSTRRARWWCGGQQRRLLVPAVRLTGRQLRRRAYKQRRNQTLHLLHQLAPDKQVAAVACKVHPVWNKVLGSGELFVSEHLSWTGLDKEVVSNYVV